MTRTSRFSPLIAAFALALGFWMWRTYSPAADVGTTIVTVTPTVEATR